MQLYRVAATVLVDFHRTQKNDVLYVTDFKISSLYAPNADKRGGDETRNEMWCSQFASGSAPAFTNVGSVSCLSQSQISAGVYAMQWPLFELGLDSFVLGGKGPTVSLGGQCFQNGWGLVSSNGNKGCYA